MGFTTVPVPRVRPQLQSGLETEGNNCAFETVRGLVEWATNGGTVPGIRAMRRYLGVPSSGIDCLQAKRLYNNYGLTASFVRNFSVVEQALMDGKAVHAAISYKALNADVPELSGDPGFDGGHAVGLFLREHVLQGDTGPWWCMLLDPLADGRRSNIAKQICMIRMGDLGPIMSALSQGVQAVIVNHK